MSRQNHPVVEVYGCKKCPFTYESPVRLSAPPVHRCPSPKSARTASAVLLETNYPEDQ